MSERPVLETRVGRQDWGEYHFRGRRVFAELAGRMRYWEMVSLAVEGPPISAEDSIVLDDVCCCAIAADPRIPALKLGRIVASYGSSMIGFASIFLPLEGGLFGPWSCLPAANLLIELRDAVGPEPDEAAVERVLRARLDRGGRVHGFGVPVREYDERVQALNKCLEVRGRTGRPYWKLMRAAEAVMIRLKGAGANLGAGFAAVCMDIGFKAEQTPFVAISLVMPCILSTAAEGAAQSPAVLRRIPDEFVAYDGPGPRVSPRAAAAARR